MEVKLVMSEVSRMMEEFDTILSSAVRIKSLRHELTNFFKKDFAEIISPTFKVIHITGDDSDLAFPSVDTEPSDYFYVFTTNSSVNHSRLCTIISLFNKLLVNCSNENHKLERDIERLRVLADTKKEAYKKGKKVFLPQTPMVGISFDKVGNITGIRLLDCVLLIRLSDHNVDTSKDDRRTRNYKIRKTIVDNICYYNVEDNFNEYNPKEKLREKHMRFIESEFREKLVSANIEKSLIDIIIENVKNIIRRHYGEKIKKKGQ